MVINHRQLKRKGGAGNTGGKPKVMHYETKTITRITIGSSAKTIKLKVMTIQKKFHHFQEPKLSLSLVDFNDALNTIRLYKRAAQACVQTEISSGNHKTKSAVLFRLITHTIEAPKK